MDGASGGGGASEWVVVVVVAGSSSSRKIFFLQWRVWFVSGVSLCLTLAHHHGGLVKPGDIFEVFESRVQPRVVLLRGGLDLPLLKVRLPHGGGVRVVNRLPGLVLPVFQLFFLPRLSFTIVQEDLLFPGAHSLGGRCCSSRLLPIKALGLNQLRKVKVNNLRNFWGAFLRAYYRDRNCFGYSTALGWNLGIWI